MTQGFRTTDRRVSTLYPTPAVVHVPASREPYCYEVLDPPKGAGYNHDGYQFGGRDGRSMLSGRRA